MEDIEKLKEARKKINGVWEELVDNMTSDRVLRELNDALEDIITVQENLERTSDDLK